MNLERDIEATKRLINVSRAYDRTEFSQISKAFFATSEDIKGYLDDVDFKRGRALSVLSSGDHVFNLIHQGVTRIDAFDINVLTYYIYYLRRAMIKTLSYDDFINFNYFFPAVFYQNESIDLLEAMSGNMPEDVYIYYRKLFEFVIREGKGFDYIYYAPRVGFKKVNKYLESEQDYKKLQGMIDEAEVRLYFQDVYDVPKVVEGHYDIILLSNISDYLGGNLKVFSKEDFKKYLELFYQMLNEGGSLINYFYCLHKEYVIKKSSIKIQDLDMGEVLFNKRPEYEFIGEGYLRVRK